MHTGLCEMFFVVYQSLLYVEYFTKMWVESKQGFIFFLADFSVLMGRQFTIKRELSACVYMGCSIKD